MRSILCTSLAALVMAATGSAQCLTTTFASNNGQSGNMFDIVATNGVTIEGFDVNVDPGTWDFEVYVVTGGGSYVGNETTAGAWTMVGSLTGVVVNATNQPTGLHLSVNTPILAGSTQGFYVTVSNGTAINYTNGTTAGAVYAADANIQFLEGVGKSYPFGATFTPRVWNGTIHYSSAGGVPCPRTTNFGTGCNGLTLQVTGSPSTMGSSLTLDTGGIPAGTPLGALVAGGGKLVSGIPLGTTGCVQHANVTATLLWLPDPMIPTSATQSVNIPADPALNGILISFQSVALTPGINALSASTSNAVAATLNQ